MTAEVVTYTESVGVVEVRDDEGALVMVLEPTTDVVQIVTSGLTGPAGPQGASGPQGTQGAQGPQGPFAPIFDQQFSSPLTTWYIVHNLNVFPVVSLYDLYGFAISGDIAMPDRNTVVVTFGVPIAGTARLKA